MQHVKDLIIEEFSEKYSDKVISHSEVKDIFVQNKSKWNLPKVTRNKDFIKFLKDKKILKVITEEVSSNQKITKYVFGSPSIYKVAVSLRPNSYLNHYTAVYIHDLTENVPKVIYANQEQTQKYINENKVLEQKNIDYAFSQPMRKTNHITKYNNNKIILLNGKNTDRLGVVNSIIRGDNLLITNVERTLIDITVRPSYAGGVEEALKAYKLAKEKVSINKLVAYLRKINYIYPYHQAVGFYLEKAGYKENVLKLVEKLGKRYSFYITYDIKEKQFSERWQLFYPEGL